MPEEPDQPAHSAERVLSEEEKETMCKIASTLPQALVAIISTGLVTASSAHANWYGFAITSSC